MHAYKSHMSVQVHTHTHIHTVSQEIRDMCREMNCFLADTQMVKQVLDEKRQTVARPLVLCRTKMDTCSDQTDK